MDKRGRAAHGMPLPDSVPQGCNHHHAEFHWHNGTVTSFSLWFTVTHSSHVQQIQQNRQKLLSILKYVVYCGKQNILLRGHRDDDKILEAGSDHNPETSRPFQIYEWNVVIKCCKITLPELERMLHTPQRPFRTSSLRWQEMGCVKGFLTKWQIPFSILCWLMKLLMCLTLSSEFSVMICQSHRSN